MTSDWSEIFVKSSGVFNILNKLDKKPKYIQYTELDRKQHIISINLLYRTLFYYFVDIKLYIFYLDETIPIFLTDSSNHYYYSYCEIRDIVEVIESIIQFNDVKTE